MAAPQKKSPLTTPKTILRLLDLEQSNNAVVNSLAAASSLESRITRWKSASLGTVLNLASLLVAPWFFDRDSSLSRKASLDRR
jgi:hypothetical protein